MPSFPRLSRHNRSQNALAEQPAASNAPAAVAGGGTGEPVSASGPGPGPSNQPPLHQQQHPQRQIPQGPPPPQSQNQIPADSSIHNISAPHSALSSNQGFSSSDSSFADPRAPPPVIHPSREPHQQQQPQGQQPPPVIQGGGSGGAPLPPLPHEQQQQHQQVYGVSPDISATDSSVFDGRRHPDFGESAVNRSQSQRYSTYAALPHQQHLQQQQQFRHQHAHSAGSASLEDLPSSAGYSQGSVAPAPQSSEKKSKRKFIKGIFSSSSRHNEQAVSPPPGQGFPEQNSYDNTSGLARRPSKRESNPPPQINTRLTKPPPQSYQQHPPGRDWHQQQAQGSYSLEASPLHDVGEADEYTYTGSEADRDVRSLQSEYSQNKTIRPVSGEVESPTYGGSGQGQNTGAYHAAAPHQQQAQAHQQRDREAPAQGAPLHPAEVHPEQQQQQHFEPHVQALQGQGQPQVQLQQQHPHDYDHAQFQQHQPRSSSLNQQQQFQYTTQAPASPPTAYQQVGEPRLVTTHLGAPPQQHQHQQHQQQQYSQQQHQQRDYNPETISQVSYESPVTDTEQRSNGQQSTQASPAAHYPPAQPQDLAPTPNTSNPQIVSPQPVHPNMAPPASGVPSTSRSEKRQGDQPPSYRHSNASAGALSIPPGQPNAAFRGDATPRYESPGIEQGRHSPQPSGGDDEKASFDKLLIKYKNVKRLYFDGKSQIENLTAQVEQLQNAVANQRITASRTALDDNEYSTRFNRLNGAINNLSFNIRKDWKDLPQWIAGYVSADALKTGTKEMTAIGRAVIARWLVDELFDKCFHPGLDPHLSAQLKEIELSIRGNAYTMTSHEEFEALTSKVVTWRMATLDGLQKNLNSVSTEENRQALIAKATTNLTAWVCKHLTDPAPAGVEGSTSMIIELAVGLCANIPLESRDVAITYPLPGSVVRPEIMEVEKLELPPLDIDDSDSEEEKDKGKGKGEKQPKSGTWTMNMKRSSRPPSSRKASVVSALGATGTDTGGTPALAKDSSRVRFAGFMAWEVRGRQVLMKAPVWTI